MLRPARPRVLALAGLSSLALAWSTVARAQTGSPATAPTQAPAPVTPAQVAPAAAAAPAERPSLMPVTAEATPVVPTVYAAPAPLTAPLPGIDPQKDQQRLAQEGRERPTDGGIGASPEDVYSEDWWGNARPIFTLHGYFRTRAQLFHNFSLGRSDIGGISGVSNNEHLWPQPIDSNYQSTRPTLGQTVGLCGSGSTFTNANCTDKSQSSANLRFRLEPEIHISDNLRIISQLDLLDNLVLGSTPDAYAVQPNPSSGTTNLAGGSTVVTGAGKTSGYVSAGYNGYAPTGAFSTTQGSPTAGINSYANAVNVNRVWGEYSTPFGQLRFGRMPNQWGLGMVNNAGDGIDSDYQSTVDRIMFVTGIKSLDLYFGGNWDYISTGPTNATPFQVYGGQPTNTCNLCNVAQWGLFAVHKTSPEVQRYRLAHHKFVLNGGILATYREQYLDIANGTTPLTADTSASSTNDGLIRRDFYEFTPDVWVQALYEKFRFEAEFASNWGSIGQTTNGTTSTSGINIRQFGVLTESEFRAMEDKLHINFGFGWASGDPWVQGLNPGQTNSYGQQQELNNGAGPISTFSFNPDYRIDLIFFRNILTRVEGAYYFRPSVDYDFLRNPNGQKFGGGAAIIWSRASQFEQTPGHTRDLGVEMDLQVYYQAKDGSLNDDPTKLGGFYSMLQYGAFFPLGGLNYLPGEQAQGSTGANYGTSVAQTVRLFMGIAF